MKYMNKKGFTLIEVIATVAVASLVMLPLIGFFIAVSNLFVSSAIESEERLVISNVKAYLKEELVYKTQISSSVDKTFDDLQFTGGKLYKKGNNILEGVYNGSIKIDGQVTGTGSVLTFTLQILNKDETVKRSEIYVVKTLNKNDLNISTPVSVLYYK